MTEANYSLILHHQPPIIVYEEDRRLYYDCLRAHDEEERIDPMVEFFVHCVEKTWTNTGIQ
ncbi:hypothetical protein LJC63_09325 [Ruminococcaceae bacterium OttesenSCG-928-L11]|nr:hypothetical protein [Ruminococcaceae bacterium OttesenSCG-928-L11]